MLAAHETQILNPRETWTNRLILGDCIDVLAELPAGIADIAITDPPYLVNYRDSSGRTILGDRESDWLKPAFAAIHRALKNDAFLISFYGWSKVDLFFEAWHSAGFTPVGHIVWTKPYASNSRFLAYSHEQAYLLAKGRPSLPGQPLRDVQSWHYSGNALHPTQKSVRIIEPLIEAFSRPGDLVLDPFCGSGTTAVAAKQIGRKFLTIDKCPEYHAIAANRLML